ncbi:hypothetical protein DFJ73DRAFT_849411 [Zopfochytrium polystomum]|nr:hypothetical protein DFJ73DRAFT_849411 [Zopfochytrium polystomum]
MSFSALFHGSDVAEFSAVYPAAACAGSPSIIYANFMDSCPIACAASNVTSASVATLCVTSGTFANAATAFGQGSTYAGKVLYADDNCIVEQAASFIKADGTCYTSTDVNSGVNSSALATISGSQVTVKAWSTADCSGTAKNSTTFGTSKCQGRIGSVVVVNGVTASAAQPAGVPKHAVVVAALASFVTLLAAIITA